MTDDEAKDLCDAVIASMARTLIEQAGVPFEVFCDRAMTFIAAHHAAREGAAAAAAAFRNCATNIDSGALRSVTGERLN